MKTYLLGVLSKRTWPTALISVRLEETAVTEWPAANAGHTQVNLNASVRRAIMGKVYSTSAQLARQGRTSLKLLQEELARASHVLMKTTPLHLEAQPLKTACAERDTRDLATPVRLSTVLH